MEKVCRNGEPLPEKRRYVFGVSAVGMLHSMYKALLVHCMGFFGLSAMSVEFRVRYRLVDEDVCHYYLAGMCPFEEFERTKHDVGPCPFANGHDEELRAEFEVR